MLLDMMISMFERKILALRDTEVALPGDAKCWLQDCAEEEGSLKHGKRGGAEQENWKFGLRNETDSVP